MVKQLYGIGMLRPYNCLNRYTSYLSLYIKGIIGIKVGGEGLEGSRAEA